MVNSLTKHSTLRENNAYSRFE